MVQRVETVAGTTVSVSALQPPTYDAAGYNNTDMAWALVGEITDGW